MQTLQFDYLPFGFYDPVTKEPSYLYRPYIPVTLGYNHRLCKFPLDCLLDSGADKNLFPAQWGDLIGINIKRGKLQEHIGIGDAKIQAYRHKITLYIGSYSFKTEADFSQSQQIPLLGREGFFQFFDKVSFNEKSKTIELSY